MNKEEIDELLIKPFKSENEHFEFDFQHIHSYGGYLKLKYLATNKEESYPFSLYKKDDTDYITIEHILIRKGGERMYTIQRPLREVLFMFKYELIDISIDNSEATNDGGKV